MQLPRFPCLCPWLLAATLAAQVATPPAAPTAKPGSIEGVVVNAVTHTPVRKAFVRVAYDTGPGAGRWFWGVTDDAGKFTIASVDPASYIIQDVEAQGYVYQRPSRSSKAGAPIAVAAKRQVTGVTMELTPLGVIAGKVLDDDGEPLRGVQVQAVASDYSRGVRRYLTANMGTTDDRGQFRLIDLQPGRYFVCAWLPPSTSFQGGAAPEPPLPNTHRTFPELGYAPAFFPSANDIAEATASVVTAGNETSGVDFRLHAVPVYHIRGKVSNLPADTIRKVAAGDCGRAGWTNLPPLYYTTAKVDGSFDLWGVTPGVYCVTLVPYGRNNAVYATGTVVLKDRNLENVNLAAMPVMPVAGVVRIEGQADLPPALYVSLRSQNGSAGASSQVKDGRFSIDAIFPETYQVSLRNLPPAMYLKAIRYGAEDLPSGAVPIRFDGSVLTLVIGADGGSLRGTVQTGSGEPAGWAMVSAVPDDAPPGRSDLLKQAITDPGGKFTLPGAPPGPCKVYAWEDSDYSDMVMVPEFTKEFAASAAAVTVSPGGSATVQVKLIPAAEAERVKARF